MYTSRLPVSTVRRPTSHADGSTSYVGLHRPSNIPVTVRKANLFTPQTKRPYQTGASTAGKSFTSGMTTDKKYKRALKPAPDTEAQRRMFDSLVEYIKINAPGFPIPEPKKFFSSISTTESARIFEFLISREIPDFKINRLEIDVPAALTRLEYPFIRSVTKSALVSVTTRQAVAGLLVIFDWLVRLIKDYEDPDMIDNDDAEDEGLVDEQNEIAKHVLMHPDDPIRAQFERVFPKITIEEVQGKLEEPNEEYERLAADLEEIRELEQEVLTLREDSAKCSDYNAQMRKYLECKRQEKSEAEQQEMKIEVQIEEIIRRETESFLEIRNHELNIDDVKKDQSLLSRYEMQLANLRKQNDEKIIENESLQKTNQIKQDGLKKRFQDKSSELSRLNEIYESCGFETKILNERRLELNEWIRKLECFPSADLSQNHKILKDFSLFDQKLRGTKPALEAEIMDILADERQLVMESEASLSELQNDTPRLRGALDRLVRDYENEKQQCMETLARVNADGGDSRRYMQQYQDNEQTKVELCAEIDRLKDQLGKVTEDSEAIDELGKEYSQRLEERLNLEVSNLVKETKSQMYAWETRRSIADHNLTVARTAYRLLKKRLNLA